MMSKAGTHPVNPFPGLRPFRPDEEYLFFGRENQVDRIIDLLAETHFLAVVGTSGSGKSSLVNCGLEPALRRGVMASAGTNWHIARLRPGIDPIHNLAKALSSPDILFGKDGPEPDMRRQLINTTLRMSKLGIVDIFKQARLPETSNLLVIVDQFEELFRYSRLASPDHKGSEDAGEEATAFVNLLLEVRRHLPIPVYIALTMRSDFLGDCAQFEGLPRAIDIGQFLVPRMTREERRAAIIGPVHVAEAEISQVLATRLVNDVSDSFDQLSVLQHALNRTWAYWQNKCNAEGAIDLVHYEAIGTMSQALDSHAERAFGELQPDSEQHICERMFRALTDRATDPRGIRRPTKFRHLCSITNAPAAELRKVIEVFRKPSRSFLMPPADEKIEPDSVIDISHESLMRGWKRLQAWSVEEAKSAEQYRRLVDTARLHENGLSGLLRDPELQIALDWKHTTSPTEAWASQYGGDLALAKTFLQSSTNKRRSRRIQYLALGVLAAGGLAYAAHVELDNQRKEIALTSEKLKQEFFEIDFEQFRVKKLAEVKAFQTETLQQTRDAVADEQRDLKQHLGSLMSQCQNFNKSLERRNLDCAIRIINFLKAKKTKTQDLVERGFYYAGRKIRQDIDVLNSISEIIKKNFPKSQMNTDINKFYDAVDDQLNLENEIYRIFNEVTDLSSIHLRTPEDLVQIVTTRHLEDILADDSARPHSSTWKGNLRTETKVPSYLRNFAKDQEISDKVSGQKLEDVQETVLSLAAVRNQHKRIIVTLRHETGAELNSQSETEGADIVGHLSSDTRYLALELSGSNSHGEETGRQIKKVLLLTLEPFLGEAKPGEYSRADIHQAAKSTQYYETELVILRVPEPTRLSGFHPDSMRLAITSQEEETRYLPWRSEQILRTMRDNWPERQN